jgi:hypothetical protein
VVFPATTGPLAGAEQQRLNRLHDDGTLQGGEVLRLARRFDARDHVVTKTDLFVECPGPRHRFAGGQIHKQHHHRRRAHVHREGGVAFAWHGRKQRLVRVRHGDFKCFPDFRLVPDEGARRNLNRRIAGPSCPAGLNGGRRGEDAVIGFQLSFAQNHFTTAAQSTLAATGVQREAVGRQFVRQRKHFR